ncbi:MAG: hypothetical protein HFJ52_03705 [Clostridia bacterium]|jgi:hypothetical protein|nr:hypothetical protein [Clostridia bacterium]
MEFVDVMNLIDYRMPIKLESLFGKDAKPFSDACRKVMHDWLYPYDGCYSANHPLASELRRILSVPEGSNFITEYKAFLAKWYEENPDEKEKEERSRKEWEAQRDKQFRIIYGIARRHGFYLKWHGNSNPCCGDQWEIYRKHERIARICC